MGVAPILAPLIGGYVLTVSSWRTIFAVLVGVAALAFISVTFGLPETKKANREVRLSRALHTYWDILRDPHFLVPTLAGGLSQAGMFAYITGSSFVFINLYGVHPQHYGLLFGANALGLIILSQINGRISHSVGPEKILSYSLKILAASGVALVLANWIDLGFLGLLIPLFMYISVLGMVFPNTTAGALSGQGHRAGAASALLGTLQFLCATVSSAVVSTFHSQSALPMVLTVGACGLLSFGVYRLKPRSAF
jgi:DHA1 family bicyclomycin/chloramphenicol resistance-like MFS transporter